MFNYVVHNYNTRVKNKIYTYRSKHDFAKKCLGHNLPLLLSDIPDIVKEKLSIHNSQGFSYYVKLYFLQHYQVIRTMQNATYSKCKIKNEQLPVNFIMSIKTPVKFIIGIKTNS